MQRKMAGLNQNFHMNDQFFLCEAEATILEKL